MFLVRSIGFCTVVIYSFLIICCAVISNTLPFETSPNLGQTSTVNVDTLFNLERTNSSRLWQWVDTTPPSMRSSQSQLILTGFHRRNFRRIFRQILYSATKQNRHREPKNTSGDSNNINNFKSHPRSSKHQRPHRSAINSTAYYLEISQKGGKNGKRNDHQTDSVENTMDGNKHNANNDRRNGKQDIFRDLFGQPGTFYIRRGEQSRIPSTNTRQVPGASTTTTTTTINSSTLNVSNSDINYTDSHHKTQPLRINTTTVSLQHTDVSPVSKLPTILSIINERKRGKKKRYKHKHKHHHRRRRRRGRRQVSKRKPRRLYGSSLDHWVNAADRRHRIQNTTSDVNNKTRIGRLKIRNQFGFNETLKISDISRKYDISDNETFNALWSQLNNTRYTVTSNLILNRSKQPHEHQQQHSLQQPQLQFQQNNSIIGDTRHTNKVLPVGGESKWLIHTLNAVESDKKVNSYNTDLRNDRINDFNRVDTLPNYLSPKVDTHSESILSVSRFNNSSLYPSRTPSLLPLLFPRTPTLKQHSAPPSFLQLSNQSNSPTSLLSSSSSSSSASLLASSSSFFPLYPGHHISVVPESDVTNSGGDHPQKVLIPHTSRKMPQALIIGVKKGGTRAVLEFLRLHPDVRAPGPEPHFFDRHYHNGLEWYRSLMPRSEEGQLTIEKTPSYFITKEVPRRVYQFSKHLKLIVVVRDPVTRAISDYTQVASKKMDSRSFEEMVFVDNTTRIVDTQWSPVRIGVYAKHLKHWLQYFPLEQMHFVSGEHLIENPADEMLKVQQFLGLRPVINHKHFYLKSRKGFPCILKPNRQKGSHPHCLGETKGRIHPMIDPSVIRRLRDFYKPFNIKFYRMVNQNFGWV